MYQNNILVSFLDPACQNISTEFHCYVSDPFCSLKPRTEESSSHGAIVNVIISSLAFLILVVIIVIPYLCLRKRNQNKSKNFSANIYFLFKLNTAFCIHLCTIIKADMNSWKCLVFILFSIAPQVRHC